MRTPCSRSGADPRPREVGGPSYPTAHCGMPGGPVVPSAFAPGARSASRARRPNHTLEVRPLAKTPRTWTGARTPSGLKRVRQAQSRHDVLQPRRSAAKTYVAKALTAAAQPADSTIDPVAALAEALSALDRAAKVGAIHPNAAARRKSRLTRKVNAALGGEHVQTGGRVVKTTGKAAAAKAAKARIAAGKAGKAKGAQTAAGKARAALSKTARAEAAAAKAAAEASATTVAAPPAKATATKASGTKATTTKAAPKKTATAAKAAPEAAPRQHRRRPPRRRPRPRRPRPRNSPAVPPHRRRPGSDRGVLDSRPALRGGRAGAGPRGRLCAGHGRLRAEDAVERRRRRRRRAWSGGRACRPAELLAPVEAGERRRRR